MPSPAAANVQQPASPTAVHGCVRKCEAAPSRHWSSVFASILRRDAVTKRRSASFVSSLRCVCACVCARACARVRVRACLRACARRALPLNAHTSPRPRMCCAPTCLHAPRLSGATLRSSATPDCAPTGIGTPRRGFARRQGRHDRGTSVSFDSRDAAASGPQCPGCPTQESCTAATSGASRARRTPRAWFASRWPCAGDRRRPSAACTQTRGPARSVSQRALRHACCPTLPPSFGAWNKAS